MLDDFGGVLRRFAVQVGTAGGGGRRGVRHLVGVGRGDLHAVDFHLEHFGHDLRDLGVQALAHLGAAVVQVDAAVGVDVDQRTGLVEEAGGEGNTEFHRGQRQAFFQDRAVGVVATDRFAALGVLAAFFQFGGHFFEHVVLDGLVVVGDVALGLAVVVGLAHRQRIEGQMAGNGVHHFFDGDHALRAAETTVSGVRRGVGLAAMTVDGRVAQVVRVVGVEHRAVDNRGRQVRRATAVTGQFQVDAVQAAGAVEAHVVLDVERVTLAGHQHVFDPRQAHFGRLAGQVRDHRAQARRARGLGFLAAETTAHAAHVDDDFVHRHVQHFGHQFLHFGGVLRRAVDDHAAVFGRHHRRDLGFQVEVFLAADVQRALDAMFGGCQCAGRIAALMGVAVEHEVAFAQGLDHVQHRLQIFVFDDRGHGGLACGFQVFRRDGEHHLTDELHVVDGQQRVAGHQRADVFQARNVFVGDGDAHAFEGVARLRCRC